MSHISLTYHIIWRTKRNKNTIREQYERELYAYILGICQSKSSRLHRINSMPDHIHLCVEVSPTIALSSEDNVRATSTKCRMEREMVHQMSKDILYTGATTEVDTHERTDDFAVPITERSTP